MQFYFDRDFDGEIETKEKLAGLRIGAIYTRQEFDDAVAAARAEGYEDGRTGGRAEAAAAAEDSEAKRQLSALEAIAPAMTALLADADRHHAVLEAQMLDFVMSVFQQVAPQVTEGLARDQALREADGAIRMALSSATLRVFFAPTERTEAEEHLRRTARLAGYGGRIEVKSDPELAAGDVRAEWDHGVMRYSFNDICRKVLDALEASRAASAARPEQSEG